MAKLKDGELKEDREDKLPAWVQARLQLLRSNLLFARETIENYEGEVEDSRVTLGVRTFGDNPVHAPAGVNFYPDGRKDPNGVRHVMPSFGLTLVDQPDGSTILRLTGSDIIHIQPSAANSCEITVRGQKLAPFV